MPFPTVHYASLLLECSKSAYTQLKVEPHLFQHRVVSILHQPALIIFHERKVVHRQEPESSGNLCSLCPEVIDK